MASTTNSDILIKSEASNAFPSPPASMEPRNPLKRSPSDVETQQPEKKAKLDDNDFASLLAQITQKTNQQIEQSRPDAAPMQAVAPPQSQNQVPATSMRRISSVGVDHTIDPWLYMRVLSIPILEGLATQMVSRLSTSPLSDTIKVLTDRNSEQGQAYHALKNLFDQTKKIYSQTKHFLSVDELNIRETQHRATIRMANVATFVASILGNQDVGFYELNDNFLETFAGDQPVTRDIGMLFLDFKTQLYLSAAMSEEQIRTKEDSLDDLFPTDPQKLLNPGRTIRGPELDFIEAIKARRTYLTSVPHTIEDIQNLSVIFPWEGFLENLTAHLRRIYEPLITPYMQRHGLTAPKPTPSAPSAPIPSIEHDISKEMAQAISATLKSLGTQSQPLAVEPQNSGSSLSLFSPPAQTQAPPEKNDWPAGSIPNPAQSAPTAVLYERARQAAAAKSNQGSARGRPGLPSARRPWSTEEENTLMAGLDMVKGPHWSQIVALYGPNGQINDVLKDRNQVQLKDKARNLKLFFLKSDMEVPYFLTHVTGDLKTRAPGQAAKKEAGEAARLAADDERQRVDGILTLANGLTDGGRAATRSIESPSGSEAGLSGDDYEDLGSDGEITTTTPNLAAPPASSSGPDGV